MHNKGGSYSSGSDRRSCGGRGWKTREDPTVVAIEDHVELVVQKEGTQ